MKTTRDSTERYEPGNYPVRGGDEAIWMGQGGELAVYVWLGVPPPVSWMPKIFFLNNETCVTFQICTKLAVIRCVEASEATGGCGLQVILVVHAVDARVRLLCNRPDNATPVKHSVWDVTEKVRQKLNCVGPSNTRACSGLVALTCAT